MPLVIEEEERFEEEEVKMGGEKSSEKLMIGNMEKLREKVNKS